MRRSNRRIDGEGEEEEEEEEDEEEEEEEDEDEEGEEDEEGGRESKGTARRALQTGHAEEMAREAMMAHVSRDYVGALRRYLFAFKVQPSLAVNFNEEFMTLLRDASSPSSIPPSDLMPLLSLAVSLFPKEPEPLAALATVQYQSGALRSSISTWEKLLEVSPMSLLALESRDNLCSSMVDRWHFRMLNDEQRNEGFREAIGRAVKEGRRTVLDVGCGTGLLSILAAREGAVKVMGCDLNAAMCEMAKEAVTANMVADGVVEVLNVHSKNLELEEGDKVGLVVSETADCGLLGERMLGSLEKARESVLGEEGRMIPCKARVYVMLLASPFLKSMCVVNPKALVGFEIPPLLRLEPLDPYLCEYLRECPYSPLTAPTPSLQLDIPEALASLPQALAFPVTATEAGRVDAIAMWWDMWLDGEGFITTTPYKTCASGGRVCSAWEQAVFVPPNQVSPVVSKGDQVLLDVACSAKCMQVRLSEATEQGEGVAVSVGERDVSVLNDMRRNKAYDKAIRKALSHVRGGRGRVIDLGRGWSVTSLMAARAGASLVAVCDPPTCQGHGEAFARLVASNKADHAVVVVGGGEQGGSIEGRLASLVQQEEAPPPLKGGGGGGAGSAKVAEGKKGGGGGRGISSFRWTKRDSVKAKPAQDAAGGRQEGGGRDGEGTLCRQTGSEENRAKEAEDQGKDKGQDWGKNKSEEKGSGKSSEKRLLGKYDVLVVDPVDPAGMLRPNILSHVGFAREFLLNPSGVVLPGSIEVMSCCIESTDMVLDNKINARNQCGVDVTCINAYAVKALMGLRLDTCRHAALSDPFSALLLDLNNQGCGGGDQTSHVQVAQSGVMHALAFWYRLKMGAGEVLETYGGGEGRWREHGERLEPSEDDECPPHWRQAAWMLDEPLTLQEGDTLQVRAVCQSSYIGFSVQVEPESLVQQGAAQGPSINAKQRSV